MRIATLSLTPELFAEFAKFCKDGPARQFVVKENALPDDAKIVRVDIHPDAGERLWRLYIQSESFADVSDGGCPPELRPPVFETVFTECSDLIA